MARNQTMVVIVFLIIFVLLAVYIAVRTASIYQAGTRYANRTTSFIDCVGYMYGISNINYSKNKLSFDLRNQAFSKYDINNINIWNDKVQKQIKTNVMIDSSKKIEIENFSINNNFSIAPVGCEIYSKTYEIE